MERITIFQPFLALMLLTLVVWLYMYARRIPFILDRKLTPDQLTKAELARLSPPAVSNPSDNLKNLFEMPVLFYALILFLYVTARSDQVYLIAAWVFVIFRVLHSVMHCTLNIVIVRFWLYAISALALWFMLLRACWQTFAAAG
jgi:hypothetical protein